MSRCCLSLLVLLAIAEQVAAEGPACPQEQVACQDCVTHRCKLVPEMRQIKKTVYEVKEVPFCLKKLPPLCSLFHPHGCNCEACAECDCPRYKKVLVKKEIVCEEVCGTKCVIECVPCRCQPCLQH